MRPRVSTLRHHRVVPRRTRCIETTSWRPRGVSCRADPDCGFFPSATPRWWRESPVGRLPLARPRREADVPSPPTTQIASDGLKGRIFEASLADLNAVRSRSRTTVRALSHLKPYRLRTRAARRSFSGNGDEPRLWGRGAHSRPATLALPSARTVPYLRARPSPSHVSPNLPTHLFSILNRPPRCKFHHRTRIRLSARCS